MADVREEPLFERSMDRHEALHRARAAAHEVEGWADGGRSRQADAPAGAVLRRRTTGEMRERRKGIVAHSVDGELIDAPAVARAQIDQFADLAAGQDRDAVAERL